MTPRELVRLALDHADPPRVPRQAWISPWAWLHFPDEVARLQADFPDDILTAPACVQAGPAVVGSQYRKGLYVDEWGCRFENEFDGMLGCVRDPLIREWSDLDSFETPRALLAIDVAAVNAFCDATDRFVLAGTLVRPFERLCFLRSMEQALADVLERPPVFIELLGRLGRHYCAEVEAWAATRVDAVVIMDDWGAQDRLLIAPDSWRRLFKPIYREVCDIARSRGKRVFMHSDGWILDIVPDLIELGVDALNSQVSCMGASALGRFRGRVTFWGEIDRHAVLAEGSLDDVRRAVEEAHANLCAHGGVIAQCEFGPGARPENVREVFACWQAIGHAS
jgi:uroporphyrinogen decarboxylase